MNKTVRTTVGAKPTKKTRVSLKIRRVGINLFSVATLMLFAAPVFADESEEGVVINGIRWATRNVDMPGTFAANPEDAGMFYQWNRKIGWNSADPLINSDGGTTWDSSVPEGTEWEAINDPCPAGWRVPTLTELSSLIDAGSVWTTQNGVDGSIFGTAPNTIFLPAAGFLSNIDGTLYDADLGLCGFYWSSAQSNSDNAYGQSFSSDAAKTDYGYRNFGFSVRCVADVAVEISGATGDCTWTLTGDDDNLTLTISGNGAMADYSEQDAPWYSSRLQINTVVITDGVTNIGERAFRDCSSLSSLTIGNSVTSVGERAFRKCSSLTSVTIPNSVISIGEQAFSYCEDLSTLLIPESVTSIGEQAFSYCSNKLTSINISGTNFKLANNVGTAEVLIPYSDAGLNSDCSNIAGGLAIGDLIIPSSVTAISNNAFYGCGGLTSLIIPESVTAIEDGAFGVCSSLISVIIPNSVTSIGADAFLRCDGLTSVTIGSSVISIGDWAFENCSNLTSITNKSATPPIISSVVFYEVNTANITLFVPSGSLSAYQNADGWKDFIISETATFTEPTSNSATIEWVAVENAAGYNISVYSDAEHTQLVGSAYVSASNAQPAPANSPLRSSTAGNILQYTIEGLSENTPYYFEIVAVDADSEPIVTFDGNFTTTQSTGIDSVLAGEIRIYPNPAKDVLHINLLGFENLTGLNAQIFDISGKLITKHLPLITINVSHLPKGVYFLKIGDKRGKFVKE
jgi:uncharacterized protein (TIGR02145 family)